MWCQAGNNTIGALLGFYPVCNSQSLLRTVCMGAFHRPKQPDGSPFKVLRKGWLILQALRLRSTEGTMFILLVN